MKSKTSLKIIIALIIVIVVMAVYQITTLQSELKEAKGQIDEELYDDQECWELWHQKENLVILDVSEQEEYCRELLE